MIKIAKTKKEYVEFLEEGLNRLLTNGADGIAMMDTDESVAEYMDTHPDASTLEGETLEAAIEALPGEPIAQVEEQEGDSQEDDDAATDEEIEDAIEQQQASLIEQLASLGINYEQLPEDMPVEMREALEAFFAYDLDDSEDDDEDIKTIKAELRAESDNLLKLVKDWLNSKEIKIEASPEKKIELALEGLKKIAEEEGKMRNGSFMIAPETLKQIGVIKSVNEYGTIRLCGGWVLSKEDIHKYWTAIKN